jgi:HK97 family phage major capsid protein
MRNIEAIKQKKGVMVKEARGLTELAEKENRNLTAEEKSQIDKLLVDIREVDEDITREERLQSAEMAKGVVNAAPRSVKEQRAAFFKAVRHGRNILNPEERALVEDANGLLMIPEDLESEIYRATPGYTIIRQLANIRQTTRDKVARRSITDVAMGWGKLETGALLTETSPTISKDYIYVEDLTGLVKIGRDELQDSDDVLAGVIAEAMAQKKAEVEDAAFLVGTGHANQQPDGVTLDATVIANYIDLDTADTMVPDDLIDIEYALPATYKNGAAFMIHASSEAMVRKVKASSNYLWVNPTGITAGPPKTFDGYPLWNHSSMIVPASTNTDRSIVGLFGNWKRGYTIVDRAGMTVQRLDELYAESGLVGFLFYFRVGGGVVRPDAFRALDNNT